MGDAKAPAAARVRAAGMILERAYGRPASLKPRETEETSAQRKRRIRRAKLRQVAEAMADGDPFMVLDETPDRVKAQARKAWPELFESSETAETEEAPEPCPACESERETDSCRACGWDSDLDYPGKAARYGKARAREEVEEELEACRVALADGEWSMLDHPRAQRLVDWLLAVGMTPPPNMIEQAKGAAANWE